MLVTSVERVTDGYTEDCLQTGMYGRHIHPGGIPRVVQQASFSLSQALRKAVFQASFFL